ncbi:lysine 2,3-aminomutase [Cephaloticoccus primus]|uniref:L-lysine 2,3-aminomutase n=1 Tax=Cephaloticoccus primus TaxID=1548207 RepID=A0A139SRT2_9BACT|nr:KamA family radical SAM protein [Cephaloticoccus primus]KXU37190.1 lysine 2,3-aminomutase [Cephaloticoccus primus]
MSYTEDRATWYNGQGLWPNTPGSDWGNWTWQFRNRITRLEQLEQYMTPTPEERAGILFASQKLALAITPYFFNLIDRDDPDCPIRKQVIPRAGEAQLAAEERLDSLGEDEHSPVPGLVHRYPDRVLFLVTDRCASYCRYCTRSRMVSNAQHYDFHPQHEAALEYIAAHPEVRDVLLSGGDPLLLADNKLDYLLGRLRAIPHVEFIRIGSRIPVFLPQRITPQLCDIFRKHGPIWMSIHVNHPKECTQALKDACERLAFAGVPLGNQSVLLRGINDDPEVMKALVHRLLRMRVRPYYIYQMDLITGGAHFKADVRRGIEIIEALRGHTTGYAVPQYVIDAPGGGGKVPINPDYIERINDQEVIFRNFEGRRFRYPIKSTPLVPDSGEIESGSERPAPEALASAKLAPHREPVLA